MTTQVARAEPSVSWETVRIVAPGRLLARMQQLYEAIAARAYEIFEARGHEHAHDWEDWFRAEAEFLRPVVVQVSDSQDSVQVMAQVLGFGADELEVAVEPLRVIIAGKKEATPEFTGTKAVYIDWAPDEILRIVPLPSQVNPGQAIARAQAGLLKIDVPTTVLQREAATEVEGEHSLFWNDR